MRDIGRDVARFRFTRTSRPSTRHYRTSGTRGQRSGWTDTLPTSYPCSCDDHGSAMAPTWPDHVGDHRNFFFHFLTLFLSHRVLDDRSDESRLEVDDTLARRRQALWINQTRINSCDAYFVDIINAWSVLTPCNDVSDSWRW